MVNAIGRRGDVFSESDKERFMGGNALRFIGDELLDAYRRAAIFSGRTAG